MYGGLARIELAQIGPIPDSCSGAICTSKAAVSSGLALHASIAHPPMSSSA